MSLPDPLPEVSLSSQNYTVGHWLTRNDSEHFDLEAPYQRASVWTNDQRVALIKSMTMGVPVGAIIVSKLPFRGADSPSWRIVDGKQRIETVRAWIDNGFECPGWWFGDEYLNADLRGGNVFYDSMTDLYRRGFSFNTPLPCLELDARNEYRGRDDKGRVQWRERTDEEILKAEAELYLLINAAGTDQTTEDLDRARKVAQ